MSNPFNLSQIAPQSGRISRSVTGPGLSGEEAGREGGSIDGSHDHRAHGLFLETLLSPVVQQEVGSTGSGATLTACVYVLSCGLRCFS